MMLRAMLVLALVGLSACLRPAPQFNGMDASHGRKLALRSDPQAAPAQWAGHYYSPQLGALRLWQTEGQIEGRFRYQRGNVIVNGGLDGEIEGNLLRFHWYETHCTMPSFGTEGSGYFLFDPPQGDETRRRLFGHRDIRVTLSHMPMRPPVSETRADGPIYATELDAPQVLPPLVCPKAAPTTIASAQ